MSAAESPWLHLPLIAHVVAFNRRVFPNVRYAFSAVATYPSGIMGYLLAAKSVISSSLSYNNLLTVTMS